MPRLLDHFSPVISEGLGLAATLSEGGQLDASSVRERLLADVRGAQASARREVRAEQDLQLASHAVVAWLDEVLLGCPGWGAAVPNLQGELLGTQIARETFFSYLEQLDDGQDEVREIYYILLCLGFRGFYGELSNGREELERLKDLHGRQLDMVPASAAALVEQRLLAQPYGVEPPPPLPKPKRKPRPAPAPPPPSEPPAPAPPPPRVQAPPPRTPPREPLPRVELRRPKKRRRWRGLVLGLMVLLLASVAGLAFLMFPGWLKQKVDERVAGLECAALDVSLGSDRIVRLTGFVASEGDLQRLLGQLDGVFGLAGVEDSVTIYPWPFCEALLIVRPYFDRNIEKQLNLALGVTATNNILKDGEPLILTIQSPNYPAYLYVDYYQRNGDVGHVAHARAGEPPDRPNDAFQYPTGFEGSEPYGLEMLTIFSSPTPLFEESLPKFERSESYFPRLRQSLNDLARSHGADEIAASLVFIRTQP